MSLGGRRRAATLLTTAALLLGGVAAAQAPEVGSVGIGDPYFPTAGNGGYDVSSYRIVNRVGLSSGKLSGRTRILARATQPLTRFNLDLRLRVKAVEVNGKRARFARRDPQELTVTPRRPIAEGERFRVVVRYAGKPARYRHGSEKVWHATRGEVVAIGEPQIAAWWFASNDHPRDKARFDISVRVPRGKQVIANGRLVSVKKSAKHATWRWRAAEPMATYLAFFAAGDYRIERARLDDGTRAVYAVSEALPLEEQRSSMRALKRTPRVLAWLERKLGDYPFADVGGVVNGVGAWFALENQTRPVYPPLAGRSNDGLLAHELAHQWFGDLVAVHSWSDIWLNEGFASYLAVLYRAGKDAAGSHRALARAWQRRYDPQFWELSIADPGPGNLFSAPVYERGWMAVAALRQRVGEGAFWSILRGWLAQRSHGSVAEFEQLAAEISGLQLDDFFDAWLREAGRPVKSVENGLVAPPT